MNMSGTCESRSAAADGKRRLKHQDGERPGYQACRRRHSALGRADTTVPLRLPHVCRVRRACAATVSHYLNVCHRKASGHWLERPLAPRTDENESKDTVLHERRKGAVKVSEYGPKSWTGRPGVFWFVQDLCRVGRLLLRSAHHRRL